MEHDNEDINKARQKADDFFKNLEDNPKPFKTESNGKIQDRLKSLKEQLEDESNTVESTSNAELVPTTTQNYTNNKPIVQYGNFSDTQIEFLSLLIPMRFHITNICAEVGISRRQYYNWLDENPAFKEAIDDKYEYITDVAEAAVLRAIENVDTDPKLALDMLKTLNKRYKQQLLLQQTIVEVKLPNQDAENSQ